MTTQTELETEVDLSPVHPGEMLLEEWLKPLGITPYRLAKEIHVPLPRIAAILAGRRGITVDTALRLSRYFGVSAEMWLGLQSYYELESARRAPFTDLETIMPFPRPDLEGVPTIEEIEAVAREELAEAA